MYLYDRMKEACAERDTTITAVLRAIGRAEGNTGSWKKGKSPSIDIVIDMADYLHMTLDEFVYGEEEAARRAKKLRTLTKEEKEWLAIINRIPEENKERVKAFLMTYEAVPKKYKGKKSG